MEIRLIEKAGVPASEIDAQQRIQKAFDAAPFTKGWRGYASFKLSRGGPGGGDDDFDLVLVTHTHIIAIELKNWRGKSLVARGGNWYVDGQPRGRSPVPLISLKAKRLGTTMQTRLGPAKTPLVLSFVVLSGTIEELDLSEEQEEAKSVLFIDELLDWTKEDEYRKFVNRPPRIKPLTFLNAYDLFFEGQRGRPAGFNIHGYRPEPQPLWEHPKRLYAEYRAKEKADPDKLALLRQWDFAALGTELIGEGERGFIGLREQRVYEHVEPRNEELSRSLLRPIARMSEADVTRDFAELYALPPKVTRLSEFVNSGLARLTPPERVVLVKAMLQRFADLHDLNVAHRDIGAHCLWVERPARVIISGFPAAYYPTMATVGAFRDRVQVERANLPEDSGNAEGATPYRRDIYMLGVLAHLMLHGERPPRVEGNFVCEKRADDAYGGGFDGVLSRALSPQPKDRYESARDMLEAVNDVSKGESEQVIDLAAFDIYKAKSRVRDYAEEGNPLADDDDLLAFRSSFEGQPVLVKEWHGVEPDLKRPDLAIRLLSFLERARNLRAAALPGLATVFDCGLSRRSLLLVQGWVEGETLADWMRRPQSRDAKLSVARALTRTLAQMHDFEWPHGDIKPDNIVIGTDGKPVYVDILDFRRSSGDAYTTAYLPADYKSMSPLARDRYALAAVLNELLMSAQGEDALLGLEHVRDEIQRLLTERHVSALEPLQSALDGKGQPTDVPDIEPYRITVRNLSATGVAQGEMVSDNGFFYLTMENSRRNPGSRLIHLTGAGARLTIEWQSAERRAAWVTAKQVDLTQLIWAQDKCLGRIRVRLVLVDGARNEASDLEPSLELWDEEFGDRPGQPAESDQGELATGEPQLPAQTSNTDQTEEVDAPLEIDVEELWRNLLDAEEESIPLATVTAEARRNPQREHQMLLPCVLDGAGFDPDVDDRTWVERKNAEGTWRRCGELELRDTYLGANAELAIERWSGKPPKPGDKLRLRSNMESASLTRRAAAVDRILEGRSVIPDLMDYFQSSGKQPTPMAFHLPAEEALDAYAQGSKRLNESQKDAFRKALQFGPLSLLQGPPGTGKTWFIASLLHYLISREGARRILVVSQAHEAVNTALEKALELFESKGIAFDAVRLGHESVVSEPIRHLHSASIEQSYREGFKAEYKERVVRLATDMGLSAPFASAAVRLHMNVGRLVDQIAMLTAETPEQVARKPKMKDSDAPVEDPAANRIRQLTDALHEVCKRDYQYEVGELQLGEVLDDLFEQLAEKFEVQSPQGVDRLRRLLKMSDDWLKTLGEPAANFVEFLAKSRTVVAGTLVGIGRRAAGVIQNMYDWVIIDEAGRAAPSELAVAMQTGRRILLVGDHKQLPPTFSQEVRDAVAKKLGCTHDSKAFASDFERVFDSPYGAAVGASLKEQYRMAPAIGELVSDVFYRGQLATGRSASWLDTSLLPASLRHEVSWVDTSTLGKSALESTSPDRIDSWNDTEAGVVMAVLRALLQNPALVRALREGLQPGDPIVGIICMYSKQREVLNRMKGEARWIPVELRKLIEDGLIAFDLFPSNAAQLLERSAHVRRLITQRHPLIIVDEAQDTNEHAWRCIELLAPDAQVICLADLEQQIFDHLPGIGPERIVAIKKSLNPLEIDLGAQNHRSGGTEIATFGQDILLGKVRGSPYIGVSAFAYNPKLRTLSAIMRMSIGMLQRAIRKSTGKYGKNVAILTHSGASAAKISAALNAEPKPVRHKLSFDEAEAMLTARFAAFLLEPKLELDRMRDLATALDLLATAKRANGLAAAKQWQVWALAVQAGKVPKAKFVQAVLCAMDELRAQGFSGDPARDWTRVKIALRAAGDEHLTEAAKNLDYLVAFNRGKRISGGLGAVWTRDGQYTGARQVLDLALAQDQILGGVDDPPGVQVMTVHKSKGKQFDGVIVVREGRHDGEQMVSSFVWWGDEPPYHRSRKILRVAITRAKAHTLMIGPIWPGCPIIGQHKL